MNPHFTVLSTRAERIIFIFSDNDNFHCRPGGLGKEHFMKTLWQLDPAHSSANFSVKHMMIAKVHGGFEKLSGTLAYDATNPADSKVDVTIEASSINTREPQRDTHLKSADFFDVAQFPTLTFHSTRVEVSGDGELRVTGDLTIRDVTQSVVLQVEGPSAELKDPWGNAKIGVSATTKIKRKDFGLTWNAALETGGVLVGDDIAITLDVQFTKKLE
jgi:polyisoprenoid-binding protein YceI